MLITTDASARTVPTTNVDAATEPAPDGHVGAAVTVALVELDANVIVAERDVVTPLASDCEHPPTGYVANVAFNKVLHAPSAYADSTTFVPAGLSVYVKP